MNNHPSLCQTFPQLRAVQSRRGHVLRDRGSAAQDAERAQMVQPHQVVHGQGALAVSQQEGRVLHGRWRLGETGRRR